MRVIYHEYDRAIRARKQFEARIVATGENLITVPAPDKHESNGYENMKVPHADLEVNFGTEKEPKIRTLQRVSRFEHLRNTAEKSYYTIPEPSAAPVSNAPTPEAELAAKAVEYVISRGYSLAAALGLVKEHGVERILSAKGTDDNILVPPASPATPPAPTPAPATAALAAVTPGPSSALVAAPANEGDRNVAPPAAAEAASDGPPQPPKAKRN